MQWSESRSDGRFVFVEAAPGIVTVLPEWMLDPVICAGMEVGAPWVTVEALINLQRQLIDGGFRRSSSGDTNIVRKERHENPFDATAVNRRQDRVHPQTRCNSIGLEHHHFRQLREHGGVADRILHDRTWFA